MTTDASVQNSTGLSYTMCRRASYKEEDQLLRRDDVTLVSVDILSTAIQIMQTLPKEILCQPEKHFLQQPLYILLPTLCFLYMDPDMKLSYHNQHVLFHVTYA